MGNDPPNVLLTDLYELTMLQCFRKERLEQDAVFELAFRNLPADWNALVACGLDNALTFLESLSFSHEDIAYLSSLELFRREFLEWLASMHFTGTVNALPEGTIFFPGEPVVQVIAPLPEAQLIEPVLLNQVVFQTKVASKSFRLVQAAADRRVIDFSLRRAYGSDAGLKTSRALYLAGGHGTSNILAGKLFAIPLSGTMAHSYVQAHESELEAFRNFAAEFPASILLVDTYDTLNGVRNVIHLARELGPDFRVRGIRLDSGDLLSLSKSARLLLDEAGLHGVEIFASGGLDEYSVHDLIVRDAPIDGFGIGAELAASADAAMVDAAYKLVAYAGQGRLKLSTGKTVQPCAKQVFRQEMEGVMTSDTVALASEMRPGLPLLRKVMEHGRRTEEGAQLSASAIRERAAAGFDRLPRALKDIRRAMHPYPVRLSGDIIKEGEKTLARIRGLNLPRRELSAG